nr:dual specificity protein phosphatase family protein [Candidatus Njordarchaeota archaeon]
MMPQNFSWLVEGEIAGGAMSDSFESLSGLWKLGIRAIVCLVEWPVDEMLMRRMGFEYLLLKVLSFMPPTQEQIDRFIEFARTMDDQGKPIVVCCRMGWGRTGSMLACYLVSKGFDAESAIEEVRRLRPRSVESTEQEEAVRDYASRLRATRMR